jgi:hypothetical protein
LALPRILHAPADVGGHAYGLSRGERALGYESDVAVFSSGPFGYEADIRVDQTGEPAWRAVAQRAAFVRRAARDYDVIHLNFGQPIVAVRRAGLILSELPLLKRLNKTVLVTFQGCDVRPQAACACTSPVCAAQDPKRLPNARHMLRHADRVFYLNPDLRRWLPGATFVPYASVDPRALTPLPRAEPGEREVVIAHGPTNRETKGTAYVIAAVEQLRAEGLAVRLDLVEGVPRIEAMRRFGSADLLVDQLHIGWYGGLAVETMAMGRPVLAHIREEEPGDNPFGSDLPFVRTSFATVRDDLRALVTDRGARERAGAAGRAFVERVHDPRAVARTCLEGLARS